MLWSSSMAETSDGPVKGDSLLFHRGKLKYLWKIAQNAIKEITRLKSGTPLLLSRKSRELL